MWLAIVGAAVIEVLMPAPVSSPAVAPLGIALTAQTVLFAILGAVQAVATLRGDLVEPRRRPRLFLLGATAVYTVVTAATGLPHTGSGSQPESLAQIAVITLILVAAATLRPVSGEARLFLEPAPAVGPRDFSARAAASPNPRWSLPSNGR